MEQLRNAFESLRNWWFDLHYSQTQKRGGKEEALLGQCAAVDDGRGASDSAERTSGNDVCSA